MMASYVFEQAGDKEAAEKIRQDSLKISHVLFKINRLKYKMNQKQTKNQPHLSQNVIK